MGDFYGSLSDGGDAAREAPVMTVSWSAALAWRVDGVRAGSASALRPRGSAPGDGWSTESSEHYGSFFASRFCGATRCGFCAALLLQTRLRESCQSSRASLCSDVLVSCVCREPRARSQSKLASMRRVPDDPSQRSTAARDPSRLVTGSVASSHLSLCEPAPSLRYRLSQCSAAAAVIFLHGKASSSADLLRCSHYTEA